MPRTDPVVEALAGVDLFAGLTSKELKMIAQLAKEMSFPPGETVVAQGDTSARFHLITSGTADVLVNDERRHGLGPGDYFGEIALIDRQPRSASVVATSPMTTLSIASFNFRPLLKQYPEISYKLLLKMCARLRSLEADRH